MKKSSKFSPEVRERAVRLVQEHRGEYSSLWAAANSRASTLSSRLSENQDSAMRHCLADHFGHPTWQYGPCATHGLPLGLGQSRAQLL